MLFLSQLRDAEPCLTAAPSAGNSNAMRFSPKTKSIICLFQHGGPSQVDLFDPKPALRKRHGKPYPQGELEISAPSKGGNVLASPFKFRRHGEAAIELSELLPHLSEVIDDVTLIRSMTTESFDHESALRCFHTGRKDAGSPSWGSWVTYGLGTECSNLPAYEVLSDPGGLPIDGTRNWSSGWLPAVNQGTAFRIAEDASMVHLKTPANVPQEAREEQMAFLEQLNQHHLRQHRDNNDLAARIQNFELAARMQTSVPAFQDISGESNGTLHMYGLDKPETREYGKRCLLARRLVEQGVRFVQVFHAGQPWDTH